jgi:hypothetical protein
MERQLADWDPAAVLAVTGGHPGLAQYLTGLLGPPAVRHGDMMAWKH